MKHMLASILPWPPRSQRKAAIAEASHKRDAAREQTRHAERTAKDIKRIAYQDNNFAASIASQIIRGHPRKNGE